MGLFDFVKSAGKMLGFGDSEAEKAEKAALDAAAKDQADKQMAMALVQQVKAYNFEVDDLNIRFRDGVATIYGKTESQAEKERIILTVGNVKGVGQVDDRMEVVNPEPEAKLHTVQSGDTLSKIAKTYYGNAMKYPVIFEANRPMLKDPDKIYPGQVLRIPALDD